MTLKDAALAGVALQTAVLALERAIAEDTVRNEYVFRAPGFTVGSQPELWAPILRN